MIFTERTVTVRNGDASIDAPVILYRGDKKVEIRFKIIDAKFKFQSGDNIINSTNAAFAQLAILNPNGSNAFAEIAATDNGTVSFVITGEMIDQLEEVGVYSFHVRLFDEGLESRITLPEVKNGFEVREPIASEDHDNSVNNAIVGYSVTNAADALNEKVPDTFNGNGDYNKTIWETGDRISEGKLNKIEDAIDKINSYPSNGCFLYTGKGGDEYSTIRIDSANKTLTIPKGGSADAGFIINGNIYNLSTYNADAVFSLEKSFTTTLGKIVFEFSSKNITVIPYSSSYDKSQYYMLGVIRYSDPMAVDLCVPYTLDGKLYGISSLLTTDNMNSAINTEINKAKNATAEISIACGSGNTLIEQLPIFDSENLTLTLPKGRYSPTGWFINGDHKANVLANTTVVLDLTKTITSSLGKILVKPSTMTETVFEYQIINWSQSYDYSTWVMIGSIRYANPPGLSLFCPFIQNGKLYGLNYVTPTELETKLSSLDLYPNPKDANVKSINHRGYNSAPENTLAAYILSKKKGYSYVECDVRFTSDGVPVLLHDADIDRTSNGTGNIADMTFEEVRALDFGSWKSSDYAGEQIPTLDEFLLLCKRLDLHPYIELKAQYNDSYQIIYDTIKKHGFDKKCTVLGGGAVTANALPHARLGLVTSSISSSLVETAKTYLTETNEVFIDYQNALVTEEDRAVCEEAIAAGIQLEVWNVFTKEDILTNVDLGATGITNDNLNVAKLMREDFE